MQPQSSTDTVTAWKNAHFIWEIRLKIIFKYSEYKNFAQLYGFHIMNTNHFQTALFNL